MDDRLLELFDQVFDADGNVRNCGRELCKQLILMLINYALKTGIGSDICFGDPETGIMDVDMIHMYFDAYIKIR